MYFVQIRFFSNFSIASWKILNGYVPINEEIVSQDNDVDNDDDIDYEDGGRRRINARARGA